MWRYLLAILIIWGLCLSSFGENQASLSAGEVLAKYEEMVSRLSCMSMRLSTRESWIPPADSKYAVHEKDLRVSRNGQDLDCFGTEKIFDANGVCAVEQVICNMFIKDKYYLVHKWPVGKKPKFAQIGHTNEEELMGMQQIFLDSPEYGGCLWSRLGGCEGKNIPEMLKMSKDIHILGEMADLSGVSCYVLQGSTKYGVITVWVAPEKSYNAVKWRMKKTPSDMYNDYRLGDKIPGFEESEFTLEISEFSQVADVFVPSKGIYKEMRKDKNGEEWMVFEWEASEIKLNPDFAALGAFKFKILDGTEVIVTDQPGIRHVWKNGKIAPADDPTFEEIDKMVDEIKRSSK